MNLLGVDSVEIPLARKQAAWEALAASADAPAIATLNSEIGLDEVPDSLVRLFGGGMTGHVLVNTGG